MKLVIVIIYRGKLTTSDESTSSSPNLSPPKFHREEVSELICVFFSPLRPVPGSPFSASNYVCLPGDYNMVYKEESITGGW